MNVYQGQVNELCEVLNRNHISWSISPVDAVTRLIDELHELREQSATAPPDENSFIGHYGEWTTLKELPDGALFEDTHGDRYLLREADQYQNAYCSPIGSVGNAYLMALNRVRPIHLPEPPQPQPEEPSLDERAWAFIEGQVLQSREACELVAKKRAQEEADKP